jgi:hypothetical protein
MKKVVKKRAKRYDDGGAVNPMRGNFSTVTADDDTDIYKADRARDAARENSDAFEAKIQELSKEPEMPRIMMGARPEYTEGKDYTIAPSPKMAAAPVAKKAAAPVSTVSSSEEGMRNYVPRKPIYRQETQRERAESYVRKRRAAQDAGMKKGGSVTSSASKRADGIATKGKTRGKMC